MLSSPTASLLAALCLSAAATATATPEPAWAPTPLPTSSICSSICPGCDSPTCKCDTGCWPGQGFNATSDHTCDCFAQLGFCKAGQKPKFTPGQTCPDCWPPENKACMCVAAVGFCEAPAKPITTGRCDKICPGCDTVPCKCPKDACWPGKNFAQTSDHECDCFAQLGFCKPGESPKYTQGQICPSCWDPKNKACNCVAAVGFCDK
jgi:hypothetical protein|eukprot:COSAG06_NODE_3823_length_4869_cov_1.469503_4_plen_206_part_00